MTELLLGASPVPGRHVPRVSVASWGGSSARTRGGSEEGAAITARSPGRMQAVDVSNAPGKSSPAVPNVELPSILVLFFQKFPLMMGTKPTSSHGKVSVH